VRLGYVIGGHKANEHYEEIFFTFFAHFEVKGATQTADRRSHGKQRFRHIFLFTGFAQLGANRATRSVDRRSHGKQKFLRRLCSPLSRAANLK
jgi:hypothetical protein